jgi:5-formyltetrahydrofolate cyclo-ligase
MNKQGKWSGRDENKDAVRGEVWDLLDTGGHAMGPTWSHIPNFIGADQAAWHLAQTEEWKRAKTVKCNPDPPQIPLRLRALYEGKMLYAPVPYLTREFPYLRIDPK